MFSKLLRRLLPILRRLLPILLCCAPLLRGIVSQPAAYGVDFWRESDGLAHSRIRAMVQTRDGYI